MSGREMRYPWEMSDAEYFDLLDRETPLEPLSIEDQINDCQAAMLRTDLTAQEQCAVRVHAMQLSAMRSALQRKAS